MSISVIYCHDIDTLTLRARGSLLLSTVQRLISNKSKPPSPSVDMFTFTDATNSSSRPDSDPPPPSTPIPEAVVVSQGRINRFSFTTSPMSAIGQSMVSSPRKREKPKRPLTAYHIYFQIEREFIIQTMSSEDTDKGKSIHEGKALFHGVPTRYKDTKLSPDWYFGPGRRAKRKHRKQHGKIGFLELSRVIASRWTKLEETDPDIKQFVSKIASQQFDEYKRELKEYRENLTMNMTTPVVVSKRGSKLKYQQTSPRSSSSPLHGEHPCEDISSMESPVQPCEKSDPIDLEALHEVFEIDFANTYQQRRRFKWGERKAEDDFVDICDDDILNMWKSVHVRPSNPNDVIMNARAA